MVTSNKEETIIAESFRRIQEDVRRGLESGEIQVAASCPRFPGLAFEDLKEFIIPSAVYTITLLRITEATKRN